MFDALSDRLDGIFSKIRSRGRLTERDVDEISREIRLALLEADVNVRVVKQFIARVKESAVGAKLTESLTPGQQFIKIVHDELVETLGGGKTEVLGGFSYTTTAGKLAPMLVNESFEDRRARLTRPPRARRA